MLTTQKQFFADFIFLLIFSLIIIAFVCKKYEAHTFLDNDPLWQSFEVISLANDHDFDMKNQLNGNPNYIADQVSLGKDGQWYQIHEVLMAILAVPFYYLFDLNGLLVFNILFSITGLFFLYRIGIKYFSYQTCLLCIMLITFSSSFINLCYSFSLDVFGAVLLIISYHSLLNHRASLSGFIWGMAIFSRLINFITLPGFLIVLLLQNDKKKALIDTVNFLLLASIWGLLVFLQNYLFFGDPFVSAYQRWLKYDGDTLTVVNMANQGFDNSLYEFSTRFIHDYKNGLFITFPLIPLIFVFGLIDLWKNTREIFYSLLINFVVYLFVFTKFSYHYFGSDGANRYFLFLIMLTIFPLGYAFNKINSLLGNNNDC